MRIDYYMIYSGSGIMYYDLDYLNGIYNYSTYYGDMLSSRHREFTALAIL